MLRKFSGYFETVEKLFPELELDHSTYRLCMSLSIYFSFPRFFLVLLLILTLLYSDMWDGEIKRRKFFENYARANDFDPLAADNWYAQPKDKIMSYKV